MSRLVKLGVAGFAATTTVMLLGAVGQELVEQARSGPSVEAVSRPVVATQMSLLPLRSPASVPARVESADTGAPDRAARLELIELDLPPEPDTRPWAPPAWFDEDQREALWVLEGVGDALQSPDEVGPWRRLFSKAVFVYDVGSGEVLFARNADDRRPVASLTKVVASLAMASEQPNMDTETCVDWSVRPSWPGARTKLRVGSCATGWDLVGAALVRSDNGAAYALADVAGLAPGPFVDRMNTVALDLGMSQSSFAGPSGVEDDNLSTARDMTRAILAASRHPLTLPAASAPYWDLHDTGRDRTRRLVTTNKLIQRRGTEVLAAKTGYTDTARHCFTGVFRLDNGREVAITTLGAGSGSRRWRDLRSLLSWLEDER